MPKGKISSGAVVALYVVAGVVDGAQFISLGLLGMLLTPMATQVELMILADKGFKPMKDSTRGMVLGQTLIRSALPIVAMSFPWIEYVETCIIIDRWEALAPIITELLQTVPIEMLELL